LKETLGVYLGETLKDIFSTEYIYRITWVEKEHTIISLSIATLTAICLTI